MGPQAILGPVFAMFALTIVVWAYMYSRRIPFVLASKVSPEDLAKPGELARISPVYAVNPSDNLKNLFEMPVLFYTLAIILLVTAKVDHVFVAAARIFVALRIVHSLIHCTVNIVMLRFYVYAASCLALFFMIGRAATIYFFG